MDIQIIAGSTSSMIFIMGTFSMLVKAQRTKDMESYSLSMLLCNNIGNVIYWLYILSLPFGPIYFLHGFYTLSTLLMLVWYLMYRHKPHVTQHITQTVKRITQTMELPKFNNHGHN